MFISVIRLCGFGVKPEQLKLEFPFTLEQSQYVYKYIDVEQAFFQCPVM